MPELIQILFWIIERHNRVNQHVHDGAKEDLAGSTTSSSDQQDTHNNHNASKTEGDERSYIIIIRFWRLHHVRLENLSGVDVRLVGSKMKFIGPCRCQGICRASSLGKHLQTKDQSLVAPACMSTRRVCSNSWSTSRPEWSRTMECPPCCKSSNCIGQCWYWSCRGHRGNTHIHHHQKISSPKKQPPCCICF